MDPSMWGEAPAAMDRMAEAMAREAAQQYELQAKQLALQGRSVEANIAHQKAQIQLRKAELAQQKYLTERSQQIQAGGLMLQARGPGNAAQYISLARRLSPFGVNSGALAQIANGGMPQGAFVPGSGGQPTSMEERMSGMLGAPSQAAIDERDRNDRAIASRIMRNPNTIMRGSLQSLNPYELEYLRSYGEAEGHDWDAFKAAYQQAGAMQGPGRAA